MSKEKNFRDWFEWIVGTPPTFPLNAPIYRLSKLVWTTLERPKNRVTGLPYRMTLGDSSATYRLYGYWGYGLNSDAFYYSRLETGVQIFLRIPYGGVATTDEQHRARVTATIDWCNRTADYAKLLCDIKIGQNMGEIEVTLKPQGAGNAVQCELKGEHSERFWRQVAELAERI